MAGATWSSSNMTRLPCAPLSSAPGRLRHRPRRPAGPPAQDKPPKPCPTCSPALRRHGHHQLRPRHDIVPTATAHFPSLLTPRPRLAVHIQGGLPTLNRTPPEMHLPRRTVDRDEMASSPVDHGPTRHHRDTRLPARPGPADLGSPHRRRPNAGPQTRLEPGQPQSPGDQGITAGPCLCRDRPANNGIDPARVTSNYNRHRSPARGHRHRPRRHPAKPSSPASHFGTRHSRPRLHRPSRPLTAAHPDHDSPATETTTVTVPRGTSGVTPWSCSRSDESCSSCRSA